MIGRPNSTGRRPHHSIAPTKQNGVKTEASVHCALQRKKRLHFLHFVHRWSRRPVLLGLQINLLSFFLYIRYSTGFFSSSVVSGTYYHSPIHYALPRCSYPR